MEPNEIIDAMVEKMIDALPYEFESIDEWNTFRDKLWKAIESLDVTKFNV